jgi:hypothetical protein
MSETGAEKPEKKEAVLHCSFCGKSQKEVRKLIAGPTVYICNECVELSMEIINESAKVEPSKPAADSVDGLQAMMDRLFAAEAGFDDMAFPPGERPPPIGKLIASVVHGTVEVGSMVVRFTIIVQGLNWEPEGNLTLYTTGRIGGKPIECFCFYMRPGGWELVLDGHSYPCHLLFPEAYP